MIVTHATKPRNVNNGTSSRAARRRGGVVLSSPETVRAPESHGHTLAGKAYVTDGDGLRVSGEEVRFAGLDAPEFDQMAKHRDGYWFGHGKRVKSALIREVGGRQVRVAVEDYDKFGRAVGVVTCNGKDVGEWLVREGHAIAAYSDRYKHAERDARQAKRGMWGHAVNIDPRQWRHRNTSRCWPRLCLSGFVVVSSCGTDAPVRSVSSQETKKAVLAPRDQLAELG